MAVAGADRTEVGYVRKHLRGCVVRTERTNGAPDDGASVVSNDGLSRRRQPQSQFTLHGQPAAGIGKDNGHDALDRKQEHQARVCWTRSYLPALVLAKSGQDGAHETFNL